MGTDKKRGMLEIALFVRAPILGRVKTRLAEEIGAAEALAVYTELLDRTIAAVVAACRERPDLAPVLWHLGEWPASSPLPAAIASNLRPQPNADMLGNLCALFCPDPNAPRRGVVAVGADHPEIAPADVLSAASLLDEADVSIGPAEDGGFWALGATVDIREALRTVPLGTGGALAALEHAVMSSGFSVRRGPTLWDIDTAEDLRRWREGMHRGQRE
ncbi:MAG: DUF2064 domain-containing protein [Proteobacteria bacterium]|nr:DUF2064 domain-containing protein [Pseudomonadota bacterium]